LVAFFTEDAVRYVCTRHAVVYGTEIFGFTLSVGCENIFVFTRFTCPAITDQTLLTVIHHARRCAVAVASVPAIFTIVTITYRHTIVPNLRFTLDAVDIAEDGCDTSFVLHIVILNTFCARDALFHRLTRSARQVTVNVGADAFSVDEYSASDTQATDVVPLRAVEAPCGVPAVASMQP